jgi:flagellum-specific peptidoglycan hydrolase FlgJ
MSTRFRRLIVGPLLAVGTTALVVSSTALPSAAADSTVPATIRVSGFLKIRSEPTTRSQQIGSLKNKSKVAIYCKTTGTEVRGSIRTTKQWDQLDSGGYISHAYVKIASDAVIKTCTTPPVAVLEPVGSMTPAQFILAAAPLARQSQLEYRVPASVTIAQAILESGWGRSKLAVNDKNYFGIKCNGQGTIAITCHEYTTIERRPDGTAYEVKASFRVYRSVLDSFRDHGRFLAVNSRYRAAFAYTNNPDRFIAEIHKAGYATSPTYTTQVTSLMGRYNLYQYDLR